MIPFSVRQLLDTFFFFFLRESQAIGSSSASVLNLILESKGSPSQIEGLQGKQKREGTKITFQSALLFLRFPDNDGCLVPLFRDVSL